VGLRFPEPSLEGREGHLGGLPLLTKEEVMTYYVKMLGSTDMPMPNHPWGERNDVEDEVRFPPRPAPIAITPGDELVYYAVGGYKRVFATARVESPPRLSDIHPNPVVAKRWPYAAKVSVRPSTRLEYVSSGPELSQISPALQDQVGHGVSHFEIGQAEFDRAVQLLQRAKSDEARKLKTGWRP
jgi:hypothetical protein